MKMYQKISLPILLLASHACPRVAWFTRSTMALLNQSKKQISSWLPTLKFYCKTTRSGSSGQTHNKWAEFCLLYTIIFISDFRTKSTRHRQFFSVSTKNDFVLSQLFRRTMMMIPSPALVVQNRLCQSSY
jgi:hypothetical protein